MARLDIFTNPLVTSDAGKSAFLQGLNDAGNSRKVGGASASVLGIGPFGEHYLKIKVRSHVSCIFFCWILSQYLAFLTKWGHCQGNTFCNVKG